jgi:sigma-B regulation protein RsbU (phosphoserine phosphatase)
LAGDLLGVFPLDDAHVGMYVLDVVGHGTAASLLSVAVCRSLIPSSASSSVVFIRRPDGSLAPAPPRHVLRELNTAFPWTAETGQFFTMIYGVLNTQTREFRFSTAGHPGLVLAPAEGQPETHRTGGFPVGVGEGDFPEKELLLLPGDVLVL